MVSSIGFYISIDDIANLGNFNSLPGFCQLLLISQSNQTVHSSTKRSSGWETRFYLILFVKQVSERKSPKILNSDFRDVTQSHLCFGNLCDLDQLSWDSPFNECRARTMSMVLKTPGLIFCETCSSKPAKDSVQWWLHLGFWGIQVLWIP